MSEHAWKPGDRGAVRFTVKRVYDHRDENAVDIVLQGGETQLSILRSELSAAIPSDQGEEGMGLVAISPSEIASREADADREPSEAEVSAALDWLQKLKNGVVCANSAAERLAVRLHRENS